MSIKVKSLVQLENDGIIELGRGIVISKDDLKENPGSFPVYSSAKLNNGIFGHYGRFMFDEELITWSVDGGGSLFYRHRHKFSITNVGGFCRVLKRDVLDYKYLFYALTFLHSTVNFDWVKKAHPSVLRKEYTRIPFPLLPEQQRIVSILDEAFAAIAKAKANAEQNLKNAKELFESYLQGVFEKLFEERETKTISEVAKVIGGYSFKSGDFKKEGKYQVIRMGNVRPGIIRENESPVFIDEMEEKALSKALLIPKDVIITQTGTKNKRDYGFTVIIEKENYLLNQRIAAIRFKKDYLPEFFLYFSWTNIFKDQYFANETGTVGQGNVGIGAITDSQVPSIPLKEQQTIVRQLDALRAEAQKLEAVYQKKLYDLEELKKSVLRKAFAGEL